MAAPLFVCWIVLGDTHNHLIRCYLKTLIYPECPFFFHSWCAVQGRVVWLEPGEESVRWVSRVSRWLRTVALCGRALPKASAGQDKAHTCSPGAIQRASAPTLRSCSRRMPCHRWEQWTVSEERMWYVSDSCFFFFFFNYGNSTNRVMF